MNSGWFGWFFDALRRRSDLHGDEDERVAGDDPGEHEAPYQLERVGAWSGLGSFAKESSMVRDLKFAKSIGLGRIDVIVNDHSAKRDAQDFDTYDKGKIIRYCRMLVLEGFQVHLMSWCMPHERYLRQAGEQLYALAFDCNATSVMLDAEEPWTQAHDPMPWDAAAELVEEVFEDLPWGVTGIGYAPADKLGPLVRRSKYMVPQCYVTASNNLNPDTAPAQLSDRWRKKMGDKPLVVGLAGYRQSGRAGFTKDRMMSGAFDSAVSARPTDIVYWSLRHLRQTSSTAKIVRSLTQRARHRAG